jgi:triosephosphate isomerase
MNGVSVEADQLGEAQACLGREQQQGVIAASEPCRAIGSGKDRLDLGPRQEMHLTLVVALARKRRGRPTGVSS